MFIILPSSLAIWSRSPEHVSFLLASSHTRFAIPFDALTFLALCHSSHFPSTDFSFYFSIPGLHQLHSRWSQREVDETRKARP